MSNWVQNKLNWAKDKLFPLLISVLVSSVFIICSIALFSSISKKLSQLINSDIAFATVLILLNAAWKIITALLGYHLGKAVWKFLKKQGDG